MTTDRPSGIRAAREAAIDTLCAGFAADAIALPELERRLERARSARTRAELNALLTDLRPAGAVAAAKPAGSERSPGRRPGSSPSPRRDPDAAEPRASSHVALAVMGGSRRAGRWRPPSNMLAMAIMGGVELDFRDAVLRDGDVTDINCFAFWGGVEIIVPPDVNLDAHGFALLGGFDQSKDAHGTPDPSAPTIRVNGFAVMGGIDINVRERGE